MKRLISFILITVMMLGVLAGCETTPKQVGEHTFPDAEYAVNATTMINICYEPDREEPIDRILCNRCKYRRKGITCDAFPDGIPMKILRSGEHFLPVDGDCGIVFEEIESFMELNLINLLCEDVIEFSDLADFSEELQERIQYVIERME